MIRVRQVLSCLLENRLFVKAEKCEFGVQDKQLLMEVDASETGVRAILSQRSGQGLSAQGYRNRPEVTQPS